MPEKCLNQIQDFLSQKRIAFVGASRNPKDFNTVLFRDFARRGYDVVPVNPKAQEIEGRRCYESVGEIEPPVDAALVMTPPETAETVVMDCAKAGVRRVWLYRAAGQGAVSPAAVEFCRRKGIDVVPGYCPYMFLRDTPWFHRAHGFVMKIMRKYPA
jgi:predicted CoA-binding protein